MNANKISEIMGKYNEGIISRIETITALVFEAGCDAQGVEAVFLIYSKREE